MCGITVNDYPSIMFIGQSFYYSILMQNLATFIVPVEPFSKDQNAKGWHFDNTIESGY